MAGIIGLWLGFGLDCRRRDGAVEVGAEELGHRPRRVLADDRREHGLCSTSSSSLFSSATSAALSFPTLALTSLTVAASLLTLAQSAFFLAASALSWVGS